jgi:regulator of protease activity HflC (stomatin/prohibitin superfamily)
LLVIAAIMIIGALFIAFVGIPREGKPAVKPWGLVGLFGLLAPVFVFLACIRIVPANSVGIPVTFGSIGTQMGSGLKIVNPFTDIKTFSTRLQESTMIDNPSEGDRFSADAIEVRGNDGYEMRVDVTVRYKVRQESASELFRRVGSMDGIRDRIVRPEVREAIRIVFATYSAEEGYSVKREQISRESTALIKARLEPYGLDLDAVLVRNVNPDATLKQAIADRSAARERALQAELEQKRQITEAETRKQVAERDAISAVTKADGEAKARVITAEAEATSNLKVAASVSSVLNDYIRAQALSKATTIYVPADATLFLNPQSVPAPAR